MGVTPRDRHFVWVDIDAEASNTRPFADISPTTIGRERELSDGLFHEVTVIALLNEFEYKNVSTR